MNLKSLLMALESEIDYKVYCQAVPGFPVALLDLDGIRERLDYKVLQIEIPGAKQMVITLQAPKLV